MLKFVHWAKPIFGPLRIVAETIGLPAEKIGLPSVPIEYPVDKGATGLAKPPPVHMTKVAATWEFAPVHVHR
jgi:hypothetical protein